MNLDHHDADRCANLRRALEIFRDVDIEAGDVQAYCTGISAIMLALENTQERLARNCAPWFRVAA